MYNAQGKISQAEVLTKYAPLVRRLGLQLVAKMPASVDLDDLIQAGMIGLLDAASRYKEDQGAQFETYASQRIRGAMLDELRSNDWLPRSLRRTSREVETAVHQVEQTLGRSASETEIAGHLKMLGIMRTEIADARDPDLKAFAQKTVQAVQDHLQMARQIQGKL